MYKTNFCGVNETGEVVLPDSAKSLLVEMDKAFEEASKKAKGGHG